MKRLLALFLSLVLMLCAAVPAYRDNGSSTSNLYSVQ